MKITKQLAESLANQLSKPKEDALKKQFTALEKEIQDKAKKLVPASLMKAYKEHPEYFGHKRRFNHSYELDYIALNMPSNSHYNMEVKDLLKEDQAPVLELIKQYLADKADIKKKKSELAEAILAFKTLKRLETDFKEAFKLVPKETLAHNGQYLPAKNIDSLKTWVKENPSAV